MLAWARNSGMTMHSYRKILILFLALVLAFLLELALGSTPVPLKGILGALLGFKDTPLEWSQILWLFRLPRALTALLAGAALAAAGLQMQTLFRNPMAEPFILGVSSGASLGVALMVLCLGGPFGSFFLQQFPFLAGLTLVGASSLGAGAVLLLILAISRKVRGNLVLLILGLLLSYAISSLVSILMALSQEHRLRMFIAWSFGSFSGVTWDQLKVLLAVVLAGLAASLASLKSLNALLLGEETASSLGVNVGRARLGILAGASLLAAGVTAFCGIIGFIGLAAPHLCRNLFKTSDHRLLLPASVLTGALLALLADFICQLPGASTALPLNAVTSLLGAPVAAWVILRRRDFSSGLE
jgi:iron complex transport system permease protein